jgi:hypothetical protein
MAKKIMICFDGTNNEPSDAMQKTSPFKRNKVKDCSISNVLKLHLMFGGNLKNTLKSPQQQSFYYPGVGTYRGKLWELFNAALALPAGDITTIIRAARKDLKKTYEPGDQIFIFGFSRGAAIARRFASLLVKEPKKYFKTPPEQDSGPYGSWGSSTPSPLSVRPIFQMMKCRHSMWFFRAGTPFLRPSPRRCILSPSTKTARPLNPP